MSIKITGNRGTATVSGVGGGGGSGTVNGMSSATIVGGDNVTVTTNNAKKEIKISAAVSSSSGGNNDTIIPVSRGGTGASSAAAARANLGAASSEHTHTATDIGAVPTTRKINGKALTADITITAADIGVDSSTSSGGGGVGKSLAGQTVSPTSDTTVTAGAGAEIFNHYVARVYNSAGVAINGNIASGAYSHAEGFITTASGDYGPHAEGWKTTASGNYGAHAEGSETTASGIGSHAAGRSTIASGDYSHAEGWGANASYQGAHAEGLKTTASGEYSHAEGGVSTASGDYSHAGGDHTLAEYKSETAIGQYNVEKSPDNQSTVLDLFVVGKGSNSKSRANAFRVSTEGVYGTSAFNASGADYAEMFEWADGNPAEEDRVGRFVTLDGEKIRFAEPDDDYILGVVSGSPSVVGDVHDDQWQGMFLHDEFCRPIWEDVEVPDETMEEPDPEDPDKTITVVIVPAHTEHRQKVNPDYDHTQKYVPRSKRPEWDAVGMVGKLLVRDDGKLQSEQLL